MHRLPQGPDTQVKKKYYELDFHCSRVLTEHWRRFACPDTAVVLYELPGGAKAGFCFRHMRYAEQHALARDWKRIEPTEEVAA